VFAELNSCLGGASEIPGERCQLLCHCGAAKRLGLTEVLTNEPLRHIRQFLLASSGRRELLSVEALYQPLQ
jgi:hypothetical protein